MKILRHILLAAALVLSVASCGVSKVKEISLTSLGIQYIVPTSARSMDAKLMLGINNPAMGFTVQDIKGIVHYNGKPLAHFTTGSIDLVAKSEQEYELPCTVVLDDGVSLLDLLVIASRRSLQGLTADLDVQAALRKNGVLRAPYSFKNVELSQFAR